MDLKRKFVFSLSVWGIFAGCAVADPGISSPNPPAIAQILVEQLQSDRKLVERGILPPSVLGIDEELVKLPFNSPRALQLQKQKLAAGQEQERKAREQLEKAQAERALYPPTGSSSQPVQQLQRMCSVNNGSVTYLVPC